LHVENQVRELFIGLSIVTQPMPWMRWRRLAPATLYALAVLTDEQYDQVTQHPLFGPAMTAKDVKLILSDGSGREVKPMAKLAVDISGLTEQEREAFKQELKALQERFGIRFKMFVGKTAADKDAAAEAEAEMQAIMAHLGAEGNLSL
jgi:hypothetical protein